jgi:type IV pilus assembly protein PilB
MERIVVRNDEDLQRAVAGTGRAQADRRLGEILLEAGLVRRGQLEQALARQRSERTRHLGRILIDSGAVDAGQVNAALAVKFGIPCISLDSLEIAPRVLAMIPEELVIRHQILPLAMLDGALVVAMDNPFDSGIVETLRFNRIDPVLPVQAPSAQIAIAHSRFYSGIDEDAAPQSPAAAEARAAYVGGGEEGAQRRPIVRLLNAILVQGVLRRASDINIRPGRERISVWYRIDGEMRHARTLHRALLPALVSRVKVIGHMNIAERRLPQEGHARLSHDGRGIDLRISVIPTVNGESVVIRILDRAAGLKPLDALGLPDAALAALRGVIARPHGLFLVTGPTGSGKSTTLYAVLNEIRGGGAHILTVEDPVEYDMDGIEQVAINERIGLGFAEALRRFLRHDPDVIMVGEIRDPQTAAIACQAALTGHFVLSTLHTNDAPGTITRLIDMGAEPCILASTLLGVVAQRLVRQVCAQCAEPDAAGSAAWPALTGSARVDARLMRGRGCADCGQTGYAGRVIACELLPVTQEIARLIGANAPAAEIAGQAAAAGMATLYAHALDLACIGRTTIEEALTLRTDGPPASQDALRCAHRILHRF